MKLPRGGRHVLAWLATGLSVALLVFPGEQARAGGNTQFRNPNNLSEVFDKTWDARQLPIDWVMSEDGLPGSGIDNATLIAELTAAFDTWEALATSELDFEFGGEVPIHSSGLDGPLGPGIDGRNLVTFTDPDLLFSLEHIAAVAITFSFPTATVIDSGNSDLDGDGTPDLPEGTYPAGTIFDGDIVFNSGQDWSVSGADGTVDIRAVALHEIGHFFGLAHSMVRDAVMWPFLADEISSARTPKTDDVAYASFYYPDEPAYSATFGAIRGQVVNGFSGGPVLGAHVYSVDPLSGETAVGAYSGDDGSFVIPGLGTGDYLVAIEPLDGDPIGLDPFRVNEVVQHTFDTNFPEEHYDAAESNVEADPLAALPVSVSAGTDTTGIDMVTNTVQVPGVNVVLEAGYNLFAYPVQVPSGLTAFDLLQAIGDETEINAIDRLNPATGGFERARWVDGSPSGVAFPIRRGEGYVVHMNVQKVVQFSGGTDCPTLDLRRGTNLIGVPCPPAGYTAHPMLLDIGARFEIDSLQRFDTETGTFQVAEYGLDDQPTGDDFPARNGEGYLVTMLADKAGVQVPSPETRFPPVITGLTPGRGVPGTLVVILGEGFDPDVADTTVAFNGIGASVIFATSTAITTTVPAGATSGPVRVTVAGQQSNAIDFVVESAVVTEAPGAETEMVSGQTADGELSMDGEQDRYTFTALAGSLVTIDATSVTAGVPDLVLLLEDPFGVVVATDDNGSGSSDPRINNFELGSTGTHTIVVSNVPGSGTGAYELSLTIVTRSTEPQVSILGGNFQTGLAGSTLPVPLSVLVTGATGAPVAGAAVTFVATEPAFGSILDPAFAGTSILDTNASGIVQVTTSLPSASGDYEITVTVPGAPRSAKFTIAATDNAVSLVETNGDQQSGTADKTLANPLEVILKDSGGGFVGGGLVAFQVVSGDGSVSGPNCAGHTDIVCVTTLAADGKAGTTFRLGKKIDERQIVAAFVPGFNEPVLFEAFPEADEADHVTTNRSNFSRMTLGTSTLNAMQILVFDKHDNPVSGARIVYTPSNGLLVGPGLGPDGEIFDTDFTNEDGLHVAALTALPGSVLPTIDEFEARVVPDPYGVTAQVEVPGGGGPSESFVVDVDMGPSMVTVSGQNIGHIIGQPLPDPVVKKVLRYQRVDTFTDGDGDGNDDDNGDFRDEDFDSVTEVGVENVTIELEARRVDGRNEGMHAPMQLSSALAVTDGAGLASVNVTTMGDIGGAKNVVGRTDEIFVEWLFEDGSPLDSKTFEDERRFAEATKLIAIPVVITVDIEDPGSGIDFSTVKALLNNVAFFDAAVPPLVPPDFPEKLEIVVGGTPLASVDPDVINDSAFGQIVIHYHPAASKLTSTNTVEVQVVKDKVKNPQSSPTTDTFDYP